MRDALWRACISGLLFALDVSLWAVLIAILWWLAIYLFGAPGPPSPLDRIGS